jgi:hypothetical protein
MKSVLKNYSFSTSAKTITLTDVATVRLDRLALITDTSTNKVLYNFADSSVSTATVATNVITLSALQGGEANGDKLRIDYDADTADTAFGDSTEAVKIQSSALPTGAATAAKQPALGTAGSASTDVITVQGIASGIAQPVSGTVSVNALPAGSAIIGKLTTDQTSHGTTDLVAADNTKITGTTIDTNSGSKSAGSQRIVIATDDVNLSAINASTGAGATAANQTSGNQQTKLTDGTNIVNVLKSDGTAVGQNAALVAGSYMSQAFSVTSVSNLTGIDGGDYRWVSVHIVTQYVGTAPTITFQVSNDNTNWINLVLANIVTTTGVTDASATASANIMYHGPLAGRYFRLSFTGAYTSGAATGTILLSTLPTMMHSMQGTASQSGTWTVGISGGQAISLNPKTSGGTSTYSGSLTNTVTAVKASAGQIYGYQFFNGTAATAYVQLFDIATGSVTLGTTAPKLSIGIPAGGSFMLSHENGVQYATAISVACTTTRAGLTAPASSIDLNIFYI